MRRYWVKMESGHIAVNAHFASEGKAAAVVDALEEVSDNEYHVETAP